MTATSANSGDVGELTCQIASAIRRSDGGCQRLVIRLAAVVGWTRARAVVIEVARRGTDARASAELAAV